MSKTVLLTGYSGFLGKTVFKELLSKKFDVFSLGRKETKESKKHFNWNLKEAISHIDNLCYDSVIHIAGKAHSVPKTEEEKQEFYAINHLAITRLFSKIDELDQKPNQIVYISTVAVYGLDKGKDISEKLIPQPNTPYGKSKLKGENEVISYCTDNNIKYLILRLPLIVGHKPPGNLGKIISSIQKGSYVSFNNNSANKSMVLAKDIARLLTKENLEGGIYNLTDGLHPTFNQIEESLSYRVGKKIRLRLPMFFLKIVGNTCSLIEKTGLSLPVNKTLVSKLTSTLTFNDEAAKVNLDWKPNSCLEFLKYEIKN